MTLRQLVSPIDGSVFAERELASDEHIDRVLSAANVASKDWRATPIGRRIQIVEAMVQYMEANASDNSDKVQSYLTVSLSSRV